MQYRSESEATPTSRRVIAGRTMTRRYCLSRRRVASILALFRSLFDLKFGLVKTSDANTGSTLPLDSQSATRVEKCTKRPG